MSIAIFCSPFASNPREEAKRREGGFSVDSGRPWPLAILIIWNHGIKNLINKMENGAGSWPIDQTYQRETHLPSLSPGTSSEHIVTTEDIGLGPLLSALLHGIYREAETTPS